jgi:hypothetical protein
MFIKEFLKKKKWLEIGVITHQCTSNELLIQWKYMPPEYAKWEPTTTLQQFPHLQP